MTDPTAERGPHQPSAYRTLRDGLAEGGWHPSEYPSGSTAAAKWYASIAIEVFELLTKAGYTLTRCTCGNEGRHGRFHPQECQTNKDWLASLPAQKAGHG